MGTVIILLLTLGTGSVTPPPSPPPAHLDAPCPEGPCRVILAQVSNAEALS